MSELTENLLYSLAFSLTEGIGPMTFNNLLKVFGTAKNAYEASSKELSIVLNQNALGKFQSLKSVYDGEKLIDDWQSRGISVLDRTDSSYPKLLSEISDAPICLFMLKSQESKFDLNDQSHLPIAIVGSRKYSQYGKEMTLSIASGLASARCTIVSGMALGIDSLAHQAALNVGGKTIAVLGCGIDITYPTENKGLKEKIIKSGNVIVSEYPPGMIVHPGLFVARNRIISGLSRGTIVIEGTNQSGSLLTAAASAAQGRDVFALPGQVTSSLSAAPHILLQNGAKLILGPDDVLQEYNLLNISKNTSELDTTSLTDSQKRIFELLYVESLRTDDIALRLSGNISNILADITQLELLGIVETDKEGKISIKRSEVGR